MAGSSRAFSSPSGTRWGRSARRSTRPPSPADMWLAVGVVLAVACVLLVARPFLREPAPKDDRLDAPEPQEELRVALAEERDRALAALKELEFDHRTGKISDED